jgi:large subunit ribosomal protein L28
MYKCDRCGKGILVGMKVSHSHIRTKKRSLPNLHSFKVKKSGMTVRGHFCTKCLRIVKSQQAKFVTKTPISEDKIEIEEILEKNEPVEVKS